LRREIELLEQLGRNRDAAGCTYPTKCCLAIDIIADVVVVAII
jgi:hypothetical protein